MIYPELLETLLQTTRPLTMLQMQEFVSNYLDGQLLESQAAVILTLLRQRGERPEEIAGLARFLRDKMLPLPGEFSDAVDTCGTGGDGRGLLNISTAAAFVVAAAGQPVVKHGNRAVSGKCGSADLLEALGFSLEQSPQTIAGQIVTTGFGFCYAPRFHPISARFGPLRKALGFRSIFNLMGPLLNPARVQYQLLGVGRQELLEPMAKAVELLGTKRTIIIWSEGGGDEVDHGGITYYSWVERGQITSGTWHPDDFGLEYVHESDICIESAEQSARMVEAILMNQPLPARRTILANAAAALLAAGAVRSLREGVERADAAISDGATMRLLVKLRQPIDENPNID